MSDDEDFSCLSYWERKYQEEDVTYDWASSYEDVKQFITREIPREAKILATGCGNSTLSADMVADGYESIVNIDYSPTVIQQMSTRYSHLPQLTWEVMDITAMTYPDSTFDFVLDKCTLDAFPCGENADERYQTALNEYERVLRPGGKAFVISFGQPDSRLEFFETSTPHTWIYEGCEHFDKEIAPHSYVYAYTISKPK